MEYIERSMPVDPSAFHHEVHLRRGGNILQRVSWHRDDTPSKQARSCNNQRQSQPASQAAAACQARHQPPRNALRTSAHTFRISQIHIAQCAALRTSSPRVRSLAAFGRRPAARGSVNRRRRPKPCAKPVNLKASKCSPLFVQKRTPRAAARCAESETQSLQ
jgi:hypothetical protein